jgi:uncharacterized protein YqgC (DUF456 family)
MSSTLVEVPGRVYQTLVEAQRRSMAAGVWSAKSAMLTEPPKLGPVLMSAPAVTTAGLAVMAAPLRLMASARLSAFMGAFRAAFMAAFIGEFMGAFMGAFIGEFMGAFIGEFIGEFIGAFMGEFIGALRGAFIGAFMGAFIGAFMGEFMGLLSVAACACIPREGLSPSSSGPGITQPASVAISSRPALKPVNR